VQGFFVGGACQALRYNAPAPSVVFSLTLFPEFFPMWFRNLQVFRLASGWAYTPEKLMEGLDRSVFKPCNALDRQAQGWVPPRGNPDELLYVQAQQMMLTLGVEQKILPVSVIRQYAQERARELEEAQGFKPGRKQQRDIFDAVEAELLPRAFVKRRLTYVWIDPVHGWLARPTK
jgi:recombination associated protein RdgC